MHANCLYMYVNMHRYFFSSFAYIINHLHIFTCICINQHKSVIWISNKLTPMLFFNSWAQYYWIQLILNGSVIVLFPIVHVFVGPSIDRQVHYNNVQCCIVLLIMLVYNALVRFTDLCGFKNVNMLKCPCNCNRERQFPLQELVIPDYSVCGWKHVAHNKHDKQ